MKGIWILLLLLITSALPAIMVFFWFRYRKSAVTLPWFLAALAAGILSFLVAAFVQDLFFNDKRDGLWPLFFNIFIRIALVEEASRIVSLVLFYNSVKCRSSPDSSFFAALGLAAGLGFAVIESAYYGIPNLNIAMLRIFTAAPLHGACGIRAGTAVFAFRQHPARSLFLFFSAVIIHGAYNLMIVNPVIPSAFAIPVALTAFFASLPYIKAQESSG